MILKNCTINIERFYEAGATDNSQNTYYSDQKPCQSVFPKELQSDRAQAMLTAFRDAGYLDHSFQKNDKHSWAELSIIAIVMGTTLNLNPVWRPFELLWHHPRLRNNYDGALNTNSNLPELTQSFQSLIADL